MREEQEYDAMYQYGGTTVYVVAPKLTDEERERRLEEIKRIILHLWQEIHS